jgi:hypothetical protein
VADQLFQENRAVQSSFYSVCELSRKLQIILNYGLDFDSTILILQALYAAYQTVRRRKLKGE